MKIHTISPVGALTILDKDQGLSRSFTIKDPHEGAIFEGKGPSYVQLTSSK